MATLGNGAAVTIPAGSITASDFAASTGTGNTVVLQATPTLTTPVLGVATATSVNKVTLTAPATSATLTIADGKTATVSNTLTFAGTDSTTMTFPGSTDTVMGLGATQTVTGAKTFNDSTVKLNGSSSGTLTLKAPAAASTYVATLPAVTGTLAALELAQTYTKPQLGTQTTDNDLSFDLSATNNFKSTPTAGGALTFTNIPTGQSGTVLLVNGSNYAITAAATTKLSSTTLATISVTGTYLLSYYADGTNVYVAATGALA